MNPENWRLLLSGDVAPAEAMAVDEAILLSSAAPTLRIYRWRPHGVSLGYFQRAADFDFNKFNSEGVPVVRRLTGGGAIFHGDEVTFSIITDIKHSLFAGPIPESYDRVHAMLARAIEAVCVPGVRVAPRGSLNLQSDLQHSPWCFHESTGFDLAAAARKLVGSAQRRTGGRVLHHGSIVLKANRFTPEVGSLQLLGGDTRPETLEKSIARQAAADWNIQLNESPLSDSERAVAHELATDKYLSADWTRRR